MTSTHTLIETQLKKPICFIGLMGAGKTRIGYEVAKILNRPFIDADVEIEKAAGCSISDIFDRFGEGYFRDGEARVINRIVHEELSCVLATGGGAVMRAETATIIHDQTICVWLDTDIDILVERTSRNDKRPLLKQGDPRQILQDLHAQRGPTYQSTAHLHIQGREESAHKIAMHIIDKIAGMVS